MEDKILRFFKKYNIRIEDIKYILREDGSTNVYLISGRTVSTYHPIKDFRNALPIETFLYPNKGIIAAASQILNVENGYYEMADGRKFKYRAHNSLLHDNRLLMLGRNLERVQQFADRTDPAMLQERFSIMDNMPMAVSVIEYLPDEHGFASQMVFRYCNHYMCEFEGLSPEDIIDHPCEDVFPHVDPRWMVTFADVALNGTVRTIENHNAEKDVFVRAYCYSPMPGFCCCALTPLPSTYAESKESIRVSIMNV